MRRLPHLAILLLVAVAGACTMGGTGEEEAADSTGVVGPEARTTSTPAPVGQDLLPSEPGPPQAAATDGAESTAAGVAADSDEIVSENPTPEGAPEGGAPVSQAVSVEEQIRLLLVGQARIQERLDSLSRTAVPTPGDETATGDGAEASGSGQVLGQARQSVRSFGVAIAWSVVVLVIFQLFIRGVIWLLDQLAERSPSRRLFYKRLVPVVRIILWIFAAYLIVRVIFRIDAQGILAAAAAIGVAVGFAAQDLLKNLFGGLILVFDQPFQVGDKISVGGTYGEVVSIGLRSTRIVTPDDNLVSVPNAQVVDQQVANANAGQLHCQVVTDLYLPGWAHEETAKRIAFNAAASSKYVYLNKPIVVLVSDQFKETFLTRVRVKAYVLDPRLEFQFQSDVTERARAGFREAGLLSAENIRAHFALHPPAPDEAEEQVDG